MTVLRGWYSQDGWSTRFILFNYAEDANVVRIELFEGETDKRLAVIRLKLKPKEMRFYGLDKIKRVKNRAGVVMMYSEKEARCTGYLVSSKDPMKVIDYKLVHGPF